MLAYRRFIISKERLSRTAVCTQSATSFWPPSVPTIYPPLHVHPLILSHLFVCFLHKGCTLKSHTPGPALLSKWTRPRGTWRKFPYSLTRFGGLLILHQYILSSIYSSYKDFPSPNLMQTALFTNRYEDISRIIARQIVVYSVPVFTVTLLNLL